ncbi:hypothetical protein F5884DRAFT_89824 [Xylogone sp. PMI_703]|nr:hypothetical protein F5884DRAFT_89824 [Xylogone sp. PMI_703]
MPPNWEMGKWVSGFLEFGSILGGFLFSLRPLIIVLARNSLAFLSLSFLPFLGLFLGYIHLRLYYISPSFYIPLYIYRYVWAPFCIITMLYLCIVKDIRFGLGWVYRLWT